MFLFSSVVQSSDVRIGRLIVLSAEQSPFLVRDGTEGDERITRFPNGPPQSLFSRLILGQKPHLAHRVGHVHFLRLRKSPQDRVLHISLAHGAVEPVKFYCRLKHRRTPSKTEIGIRIRFCQTVYPKRTLLSKKASETPRRHENGERLPALTSYRCRNTIRKTEEKLFADGCRI